ncbi:GNAT family protein [Arthrobacter sp. ATA002]|nr:GNAT family protein [Arthrobacter sp. ATA002]WAP52062.1 GNAT family protein [Arthrobacter sp. ATA002]
MGNVGISSVDVRHGTAWLHYWLAAPARGRGLAVRAVASLANLAFGDLQLHRLELGHRTNNPASCKVAGSAGFAVEGVQRAKLRYGTDRFDVEIHARLATDPVPGLRRIELRLP